MVLHLDYLGAQDDRWVDFRAGQILELAASFVSCWDYLTMADGRRDDCRVVGHSTAPALLSLAERYSVEHCDLVGPVAVRWKVWRVAQFSPQAVDGQRPARSGAFERLIKVSQHCP